MAAVDDAAWLQMCAIQRVLGILKGPTDPTIPAGWTAAANQGEIDKMIAKAKREGA